ncbi:unnamed protein product [Cylicocyclus nassatus]|uniref:Uncharacterized protein n=1 Tax=Cylicocyclus nassatus TaxID=53992 RepID=A0AA36HEG5_CYLNA|nr:unnamed protein product [Cylicocyclus nassatus]
MTSTSQTSNEVNGKDADDEDNEDEDKEVIRNIYLHICNEEGREFTGVTTFHGMSGYILSNYAEGNTFMRRHIEHSKVDEILVLLCRPSKVPDFLDVRLAPSYTKRNRKGSCLEITASSFELQIYVIAEKGALFPSDMYIMISSSNLKSTSPIYIRDGHHHRIFVEASQGRRRFAAIQEDIDYPCHPACSELRWRNTVSHNRISKDVKISIQFSKTKEMLVEVRKLAITDVLSLVGGGTSLFLGCSCVTLMETFIFLLKLVLQSVYKEAYEGAIEEEDASLGQSVDQSPPPKAKGFDVKEELDAIASTTMLSPPRKSIHCVRFLSKDENEEGNNRPRLYRPHPPSLAELRTSTTFNTLNSHNIERSLKNLPISQRLTFDRSMERRHLRRQSAIEVSDENLDQYLNDPPNTRTRSFVDDFDRKHPARLKIRRISSVTSRGSASSSRTNVHIVEHPRRRSQIYNKFMTMNDF